MMDIYYNNNNIKLAVVLKILRRSAPISLHSFQLNILHCVPQALLKDILWGVLKERTETVKINVFLLKFVILSHLLPPNLSIILVYSIIFRNVDVFLH